jgi:hypothetical protein
LVVINVGGGRRWAGALPPKGWRSAESAQDKKAAYRDDIGPLRNIQPALTIKSIDEGAERLECVLGMLLFFAPVSRTKNVRPDR